MPQFRFHLLSFFILATFCCNIAVSDTSLAEKHYNHLKEASVEIVVNRRLAGSGCLVNAEGLVMTAAHVLGKSPKKVEILFEDSTPIKAEIVAKDLGHDIALLKIPKPEKPYAFLELATKMPAISKRVFLYGAPFFRHRVLFPGAIARNDFTYEYLDQHYVEVIHIAASSPKGVSGGPWVNQEGKLCGIQSGMLTLNNAPQGLAFVAPLQALQKLLQTKQTPAVSSLGIAAEELWEQDAKTLNSVPEEIQGGVYAKLVKEDGPFVKAGLKKGTIILKADGKPTHLRDQFLTILRSKQPGEKVKLSILTPEGKREEVEVPVVELSTLK